MDVEVLDTFGPGISDGGKLTSAGHAERFKWKSFEEWKSRSWDVRIAAAAIEDGREDLVGFGKSHSGLGTSVHGMRTAVGAMARHMAA